MKFEPYHDSALARFLLKRGLRVSTQIQPTYAKVAGIICQAMNANLYCFSLPVEQKNWSLLVLVLKKRNCPVHALPTEVCSHPRSLP